MNAYRSYRFNRFNRIYRYCEYVDKIKAILKYYQINILLTKKLKSPIIEANSTVKLTLTEVRA